MTNLNLIVLGGCLAAPPELRTLDSGSRWLRYLLTVRSASPASRVDVIPVGVWEPNEDLVEHPPDVGTRVWVAGSVQRRFWSAADRRRSRLEVIAHHIEVAEPPSRVEGVDSLGRGPTH
jgi:single-stranded DNA-binding protein